MDGLGRYGASSGGEGFSEKNFKQTVSLTTSSEIEKICEWKKTKKEPWNNGKNADRDLLNSDLSICRVS